MKVPMVSCFSTVFLARDMMSVGMSARAACLMHVSPLRPSMSANTEGGKAMSSSMMNSSSWSRPEVIAAIRAGLRVGGSTDVTSSLFRPLNPLRSASSCVSGMATLVSHRLTPLSSRKPCVCTAKASRADIRVRSTRSPTLRHL